MVTLFIANLALGANTASEGKLVSSKIIGLLDANDVVNVSFRGITTASSSFVTTAFIEPLHILGFDEFKRRILITDATWQIADILKRRVAMEAIAA
jgi:hypothetical protein